MSDWERSSLMRVYARPDTSCSRQMVLNSAVAFAEMICWMLRV